MHANQTNLTLVLFTRDYPYSYNEQFFESEIPYLAARFKRVIIFPRYIVSGPRPVPPGVEVYTCFSEYQPSKLRRMLSPIGLRLLLREMLRHPRVLRSPALIQFFLGRTSGIVRGYWWLLQYLQQTDFDLDKTVFYTYWLEPMTLAIGLARRQYPQIKLISRAHGHDLYDEVAIGHYLPYKAEMIRAVDHLFLISQYGRDYLTRQYSWFGDRCTVAKLGINDPGFDTPQSTDGSFRVVSCSYMVSVKRLDRIIEGLSLFARNNPQLQIEWNHMGDGELRGKLEALANQLLPDNVRWLFHGQLPNPQVIEFYRTHPVDVLINASESEGLPVSVMEAQSCSIPVIATAVGGTPEIVSDTNGILLSKNPAPQIIADSLQKIAENPDRALQKRIASKRTWQAAFDAERNYHAFVDRIIELFSNPGNA